MKRATIVCFAGALALATAVTACSSSGKSAGSSTATTAGSSAPGSQATGSPINVGLICDCSGPLASAGEYGPDVYKAFVNTVNASGGIDGHPIKVYEQDTDSVAANAVADAQTLLSSDHVVAMVDDSNLDQTFASAVQSAGVPVVGMNTSEQPMYTNPDFYPEGQTEDALFPSIIEAAKTAGATNLGLLYCAEAVQCEEGIAPLKATGKALGLPVSYSGQVAATAPNYTAQCIAAQQDHISELFVADVAQVAEKVATNCSQQNYNPGYVVDGQILQAGFLTTDGIKANFVSPVPNLPYFANTPAVQAMNAAVDKYYPGIRNNKVLWTEYSVEAWPAALLLEDAVKAGGLTASATPTAAEIVKGLQSLNGDTLDGWAPPLTFAAGKAHPVDCWFTANIKNGSYGMPLGTKTTCESNSSQG